MENRRSIRGYKLIKSDELKDVAWILHQHLWVTQHGLLTDVGFRDHYGRAALKGARKVALKFDHLRFCPSDEDCTITDGLGRDGLNLFHHPFFLHCFFNTMWRFSVDEGRKTFADQNDLHAFYGWVEHVIEQLSIRDGQKYVRPANMFSGSVHLDH
ncbi:hypothetical protein N4R57_16385 [Rhodobacteraceae bacterium D3-12]|nr:hypothetical protein N4R57_16385 [Rhodobacteraceae bacterium D3-12]